MVSRAFPGRGIMVCRACSPAGSVRNTPEPVDTTTTTGLSLQLRTREGRGARVSRAVPRPAEPSRLQMLLSKEIQIQKL